MLINYLENFEAIHGRMDALLIVSSDDIIEYSAMITDDKKRLITEDIIGQKLYNVYPSLTKENSTHARVLKEGKPVLNEKQELVDINGKKLNIITSTFPIENNGCIIGTIDVSVEINTNKDTKKDKQLYTIENIITENSKMIFLKEKIKKIAKNDSTVLIIGESGTGKELFVESIHTMSSRSNKPFISLNCAAIPDSLMESILFGTIKGSFTGAENKKGIFEIANKGTLFLDEINSMNIELQAKLLKVVEEQKYMKIGGEKYIDVDVRIVSAMNITPAEAIEQDKLRKDLYYRLGVVQVAIPPLRERKEDVILLADYFIKKYNKKMNKNIVGFKGLAKKILLDYDWPGNVRELKNVIESAFNVADEDEIKIIDMPEYLISNGYKDNDKLLSFTRGTSLQEIMNTYEKGIIIKVLNNSTSLTDAANALKITRQAVKYKINKYDIDYKNLLK